MRFELTIVQHLGDKGVLVNFIRRTEKRNLENAHVKWKMQETIVPV